LLSEVVGKSLELSMTRRGITIGNINWQEMGNWSVFKPEGIRLHMHVFGRAKEAKTQKYGEAVKLPFRDNGFYDDFQKLNDKDINDFKKTVGMTVRSDKFTALKEIYNFKVS
jgi:hypothetical protein